MTKPVTRHPLFLSPDYPASQPLDQEQIGLVRNLNARLASGELAMERVPCLCGGEDFDLIARYDRYRVAQDTVICRHCGLMQGQPRMAPETLSWFYSSDAYRRLYGGGGLLPHTQEKFLGMARARELHTVLAPHLAGADIARVAEIGCGGGWNLWGFHQGGRQVVGCDYSPELTAAGRTAGMDIRQGDAGVLNGEKADLLILSHVVEHFPDPIGEVKRVAAMLAPRHVYIEVPDVDSFCSDLIQSAHLYYFSAATLVRYMANAGLTRPVIIPRGCHLGVLFQCGPAGALPDLSGEYRRTLDIVHRYQRRETIKGWMRASGLFPIARRLISLLR